MVPTAAARQGLGDFDGTCRALMTAPDLVAGNARERNLRGDRCQRVNGSIRETTEPRFRPGSVPGTRTGRRGAQGRVAICEAGFRTATPARHTGLDILAVPSDISVMTETTDK